MSDIHNFNFNPFSGEKIYIHYTDEYEESSTILEFDTIPKAEEELSKLYEREQDKTGCGVHIKDIIVGRKISFVPIETIIKVKLKKMEDESEVKRP